MDVAATAEHRRSPSPQPPISRSQTPDPIAKANGLVGGDISESDNKFQKAISAWRNIDFAKLIPSLDSTASDISANQRDALVERKELAQKTKDFRKLEDAAKITEIKGLLKAYQTYIDLISNQSKTVSTSFLQVYSSLSEAPDPYPLLEASIESLITTDETVPRLEADNKHLRSTITKLTTQVEETERRLENETSAKQSVQQSEDAKVKDVQESWSKVLAEKQDNWAAKEKSLEEKVENQERLLKELKASYEVSQRLGRGEESENVNQGGATAAEVEMLSSDLERAHQRLSDVEARNEQMRVELAQSTTQKDTKSVPVEEEPAYLRLRSENSSLLRKADTSRFERESDKRESDSTIRNLKREISALKDDTDTLRAKIHRTLDYEDVKRELEVLKSIEFATGDNDEAQDDQTAEKTTTDDSTATASASAKSSDNLEQLLLARNKKLNNELTVLRVSHQDLVSRLQTLQEEFSTTNMELERSRNLNAQLENDLAHLQQEASSSAGHGAMSIAPTYSSRYPTGSTRRGRPASPTSSIISGFDTSSHSPSATDHVPGSAGANSSILPMLTAQRDRFKKRTTDLESELNKTYSTVSSLRSEITSLQKDNLTLYERTRYQSAYSQPSTNTNPSTIQVGVGTSSTYSPATDRYKSAYETSKLSLNPLAAFRGRESARMWKRMSLPERSVLQVAKVVLANRWSRNLFAVYLVGIHVLVFAVLLSEGGGGSVGVAAASRAAGESKERQG